VRGVGGRAGRSRATGVEGARQAAPCARSLTSRPRAKSKSKSKSLLGAGEVAEALDDGGEVFPVAEDEEDGVVAGDGAEDLVPLLVVDADGEGLCAAGEGAEDEKIVDALGIDEEGGHEAGEGRCGVDDVGRDGVGVDAVGVGGLDEAELLDVTGEGALSDVEAAGQEEFTESLLGGDAVAADQVEDGHLPLELGAHEGKVGFAVAGRKGGATSTSTSTWAGGVGA
jgi:hypothetical protein